MAEARISQYAVEVIREEDSPVNINLSQYAIEVVRTEVTPVHLRLTQYAVEVIISAPLTEDPDAVDGCTSTVDVSAIATVTECTSSVSADAVAAGTVCTAFVDVESVQEDPEDQTRTADTAISTWVVPAPTVIGEAAATTISADTATASWTVPTAVVDQEQPATGNIIQVASGGDLQAAIDAALPGDTIELEAGGEYVGAFTLPNKVGSEWITITTDATLPERRITPADLPLLATIRASVASTPPMRTRDFAHNYIFKGIAFTQTGGNTFDLLRLGTHDQPSTTVEPHDFIVDRCYFYVADGMMQRRGIVLHCLNATVKRCWIENIKDNGQDSAGIGCTNGSGNHLIQDNYIEAASENILYGGDDPRIDQLVTTGITIEDNTITKRTTWPFAGHNLKNLFELKNARTVIFRRNVCYNNWGSVAFGAAQDGWAIVLTPRNQGDGAPWVVVEDVIVEYNVLYDVGGGVNILGSDNEAPSGSQQTNNITIRHNLIITNKATFGGPGRFLLTERSPFNVTVENNTVHLTGSAWMAVGHVQDDWTINNNLSLHRSYGVIGTGTAPGTNTLNTFFTNSSYSGNILATDSFFSYPAGFTRPTVAVFKAEFIDYDGGDYELNPGSTYTGKGCDFTGLPSF